MNLTKMEALVFTEEYIACPQIIFVNTSFMNSFIFPSKTFLADVTLMSCI